MRHTAECPTCGGAKCSISSQCVKCAGAARRFVDHSEVHKYINLGLIDAEIARRVKCTRENIRIIRLKYKAANSDSILVPA